VFAELGLENPVPKRVEGRFIWEGKMNLSFYNLHFEEAFLDDTKKIAIMYATRWM